MCGIFAYKGDKKNAPELVVNGLKKLEYRGYDSWGVAYRTGNEIKVYKEIGKIGEFDIKAGNEKIDFSANCNLAMGHSRWATHGGVTKENAHPHYSEDKEIAIVHNGIIENYAELKKDLIEKGYKFRSETDTEVIAYLIEDHKDLGFTESVKKAISMLQGRYAIVVMNAHNDALIAARRGSPIIIGKGKNEYFIASDIPAFLEYTREVIYLDDNQMIIIEDEVRFVDLETNKEVKKRIVKIDLDAQSAEKGEFPHFMIKEITEQKETIARAINQDPAKIMEIAAAIKSAYGTYLVGCGTAGKVCLAASYHFAKIAKRHVNFAFGSEFPSLQDFITDKSLVVAVSQSGETADTLDAIEVAKKKGAKVLSIINVEGSSMDRISDYKIYIKAGPEKAVASTKATTAQMAILTLLAYACAGKLDEGKRLLVETASRINDMLNPRYEAHIQKLAQQIKDWESIYVIGKGQNYPMALEAAIKLQEVSYIHAEGFAGGELKHGPIALISKGTPCIVLVANDETKQDILSNAMEIKSRGGYIIGIAPENNDVFDYWIKVPESGNASPIVNIIPVQILAYQLAILRENNPDMPRNLAKSVTVK
ncbi:glutamine--fructose-6-phosphate transaminase (isomerizing) [Patescibacteria group bacterium]|nr:glutamine--fructose-6-phosphate transaminase (isomerizing) [Patescibacteria group bacterium]